MMERVFSWQPSERQDHRLRVLPGMTEKKCTPEQQTRQVGLPHGTALTVQESCMALILVKLCKQSGTAI